MTKRKFLKLLEQKLSILNDAERNDIISEYSDIIDEKVKHGKTEKEATNDFGDIDELVSNILESYKINPNYTKQAASDTKKIMNAFEETVHNFYETFSKGVKNTYSNFRKSNGEINLELIFEIICKTILILLVLIVLRLPFLMINDLGKEVLDIFFPPMNSILTFIWSFITVVIYIASCILIVLAVFRKYFTFEDNAIKKANSLKKTDTKIEEKQVNPKTHSAITVIVQIMATLIFLFPIWCVNFGLMIAIVFFIYLLLKGVSVLGIVIILIGLSFLFGFLADILNSFIYTHKKIHFFPFMISTVLIMIGSIVLAYHSLDFEYIDGVSENVKIQEKIYEEVINNPTEIEVSSGDIALHIDDALQDGSVVLKVTYYDSVAVNLRKEYEKIEINTMRIRSKRNIFDLVIEDLKDNKIYDYRNFFDVSVDVYANKNTIRLIKGD